MAERLELRVMRQTFSNRWIIPGRRNSNEAPSCLTESITYGCIRLQEIANIRLPDKERQVNLVAPFR
ncbi:hypothetical protein L596_009287 [Steinernema carpocapsae]|uniref:Uncharacterized protein n=1 Tax=Steinernema carpocapsae TaxID=34508 RepID=A0A4U5PEW7_STECR|nr:hypothetical protein L596_009287 [Steinernema carpocapsae]